MAVDDTDLRTFGGLTLVLNIDLVSMQSGGVAYDYFVDDEDFLDKFDAHSQGKGIPVAVAMDSWKEAYSKYTMINFNH